LASSSFIILAGNETIGIILLILYYTTGARQRKF
jgi:hypothetical protein